MHSNVALTDADALRSHTPQQADQGAVTASYSADREQVINLLNDALATEMVCALRHRRHHFMAHGIHSQSVTLELPKHSSDEQSRANSIADQIAERIVQLGGELDFRPKTLEAIRGAEYGERKSPHDRIRENLVAERNAIDSYRHFIRYLGANDNTTRRMLERILAMEEKHADGLADQLLGFVIDAKS